MPMELRQTRDLAPAELHETERDWSLLLRSDIDGDLWYRVLAYLTYAFIGFLILFRRWQVNQDSPQLGSST